MQNIDDNYTRKMNKINEKREEIRIRNDIENRNAYNNYLNDIT